MADPAPKPSKLPILVSKPTPYTFDLGLLCAFDPNPLPLSSSENLENDLAATARDGAQALLNQLLSTCPILSTPAGVLLSLPGIETRLPREKVCFPHPPSLLPPCDPEPRTQNTVQFIERARYEKLNPK
jgi:regulator of ribosome biosynthesis